MRIRLIDGLGFAAWTAPDELLVRIGQQMTPLPINLAKLRWLLEADSRCERRMVVPESEIADRMRWLSKSWEADPHDDAWIAGELRCRWEIRALRKRREAESRARRRRLTRSNLPPF